MPSFVKWASLLITTLPPLANSIPRLKIVGARNILGLISVFVGWVTAIGPLRAADIRHRAITLPLASLPKSLDELKITLISDLHVKSHRDPTLSTLDSLAGTRPDLLVVAGDLVEKDDYVPDVARRLKRINARYGTFVVWGNHDAFGPPKNREPKWITREARPLAAMERVLENHEIQTLTNRLVGLSVRGAKIQIVGIGDTHVGLDDLDQAFAEANSEKFTIFISHNPDGASVLGEFRADVTLSGHTHGGQIVPPIVGPLTLRTRYPLPKPCGLMYVEGRPLVISAGVGTVGLPFRVNAPADITELRIVQPIH